MSGNLLEKSTWVQDDDPKHKKSPLWLGEKHQNVRLWSGLVKVMTQILWDAVAWP